jgi:hypothetical protein
VRPVRPAPPPPDSLPELVGAGIVSTDDDEFAGALSPDGEWLYYNKTVPPHYLYVLYRAHWVQGAWTDPRVLPFSGRYRDTDPTLSPDGKFLLFASDRPVHGVDQHRFTIWRSTLGPAGWSEPEYLDGPVNSEGSQVFASMAANGTIYFTSNRKTGYYDIFRSRLEGGVYQPAEDLGPALNGEGIASYEAYVAPDESYLLIGSFGRPGGRGNSDLFISFHQTDGSWGAPVNLGPTINTSAREYSPRLSPDGQWLYFTSERRTPLPAAVTYDTLVSLLRGRMNGLGNIYRIPMRYVLERTRR